MSETKIANRYPTGTAISVLYDLLADQTFHSQMELENKLSAAGHNAKMGGRLSILKKDGLIPKPPAYPMGQWTIRQTRGQVKMTFQDPVQQAVGGMDEKELSQKIEQLVGAQASEIMKKAIATQMETVEKSIEKLKQSSVPILEIHRYESSKKVVKSQLQPAHEKMELLIKLLMLGEHAYLYGPPGSGKSTAAMLAAEAMGRKYGYISLTAQTTDSRLMGFIGADGKAYHRTAFRDCYETGGLFCIDEMDNASGNLLTSLNGALENDRCAFPDKTIKRHKDFVVVATGNTSGSGPNPMFPERRPFDKAFAERFTYVEWSYDTRMERAVSLTISRKWAEIWCDYTSKLRAYCTMHQPKVLVSPRASFKGCKYLENKTMKVDGIMDAVIFKGVPADLKRTILAACPVPEPLNAYNEGVK